MMDKVIDYLIAITDTVIWWTLPALVVIGIMGNLFTVWLIRVVKALRARPPNIYLAFIAASDACFLIGLLPQCLISMGLIDVTRMLCTIPLFLLNSSCMMSAWLISLLAVERCVVVTKRMPRALADSPSVHRSMVLALAMMPFPFILNTTVFITSTASEMQIGPPDANSTLNTTRMECYTDPQYLMLAEAMNIADFILAFLLPLIIVNVANLVVFCHLRRKRALLNMGKDADNRSLDGSNTKDTDLLRRHVHQRFKVRQKQQLAGILVVVPTIFLGLNLPSYTMRMVHFLIMDPVPLTVLFHKLFTYLHYVNFAINFAVYSFASRSFQSAAPAALKYLILGMPIENHLNDTDFGTSIMHTYMQHRINLMYKSAPSTGGPNSLNQPKRSVSLKDHATFSTLVGGSPSLPMEGVNAIHRYRTSGRGTESGHYDSINRQLDLPVNKYHSKSLGGAECRSMETLQYLNTQQQGKRIVKQTFL